MDLQINNLCFQYEKNNLIFENINLQANMGDIISIQGYNGSGKTTFLKLLAGLLTPSKGTIMYKDIYVDPKSYKKIMAYIPTELYTFDMLTGIEHAYLCVDLWDMREHKNDYVDYFYMLCDKLHTSEHLEKDYAIVPMGQNIKYTLRLCLLEGQNLYIWMNLLTQWMNLPVLSLYNT